MARPTKAIARTLTQAGTDRLETDEQVSARRFALAVKRARELSSIPERIAGDKFAHKNCPIPNGEKHFPLDWRMRYVSLCYPHAEGGALWVDVPMSDQDIEKCKAKAQVLKAEGLRYLYLTPQMDEAAARSQLEGRFQ